MVIDTSLHYSFAEHFEDVAEELNQAVTRYAAMNSAHEGWAVIKEELDELWEEVRVKQGLRSSDRLRKEAIQVAAMAVRFLHDVCGKRDQI